MGFAFPWESWFKSKLRSHMEVLFNDFEACNELEINIQSAKKLWDMFLRKKGGINWFQVWSVYVLLSWLKRNILEKA
jgi:hypothetical protein